MSPELRGLDVGSVNSWMVAHVPGCVGAVEFSLIAGGHSNLTYGAVDAAGHRYVIRRGPLGRSGGRAHDMSREYLVIDALAGTSVPVPKALALCDDEGVNGAPFYVMSRVEGAVIDNTEAADEHLPELPARRRAGEQIIDVLADLHLVNIDAVGLGGAAKRDKFLLRQIKRFGEMWQRNATRDLPAVDSLAQRLAGLAPPQRHTGIVHGDYRLGNVMLGPDGTLTAVLDWELWTLGDPLADLGFVLNNWYEPDDPTPLIFIEMPPTVTGHFGSRSDVIERYAARTGFDVSAVEYYRGFQHWRMAVLAEGVKKRYETAQLVNASVDMAHLDRRVIDLVELADLHLTRFSTSQRNERQGEHDG
jgi:aminoglycoside phosphotransferase (APT) family kinase protein